MTKGFRDWCVTYNGETAPDLFLRINRVISQYRVALFTLRVKQGPLGVRFWVSV